MNKYIFNLILSISLVSIVFSLSNKVYAFGGRNGECADAQLSVISNTEGNAYYKTYDKTIITGICIKAGNDMFGDGHSDVLSNGIYENGCYEVKGVGTDNISVTRLKDGDSCKEVSHIDIYNSVKSSDPIIETPKEDPKEEIIEQEPVEEKQEEIITMDVIEEENEEIIEDPVIETEESTNDEVENIEEDEEEEEDEYFEELAPEVKAKAAEKELAAITELPETGAGNLIVGLFGFLMSAVGFKKRK
ncbi:LPXTG cell wall anchor domain-containing protein [Patescibacteria group bacterium]|nr:LPXTG cell wall anchor domain-containing protein [Patescibacteria group bacterium]